ncbi:diacylglycerol kinase [Vibrio owensii]|jgi:diacylglycerol kinase (ATP)|uniref:Diacylglycerol kinase n=6 Tax=Vibrio harveyi group TaxID=717610 RepID=A0AAP9KBC6_9VIBR|nr:MULTISPECIES: diacylglycerol kinase [Vibrio]KCV74184.1 DeoR faimly transcriptional regulator [Vibrio parahaemolyticus VP49]KIP78006.1 DeoR faimly transcriptional regulator [Vibrio harveyi]AQM68273.1 Diacylglycerol kinase [Vibrio campbellii]AYO15896.1 diacylglycerol kinase [Vibrio owensii]EGQ8177900.1 diacylglycerol kinase [Vibrio parahaemolyticus]
MSNSQQHQSPNSGKPGNTGLKRIIKATGYSAKGLRAAFKHEAAIRQELVMLAIAIVLVCVFDLSVIERILMLGVVVLVLIVELINSAIEAVVDRVGVEHHELSGRAKDIGSAAVMVALAFAGFTWLYILLSLYL